MFSFLIRCHFSTILKLLQLVVKVPQKTLLMDALKEETEIVYDFCMCNPPFFANQLEAKVQVSLFFLSHKNCSLSNSLLQQPVHVFMIRAGNWIASESVSDFLCLSRGLTLETQDGLPPVQ